MKVLDDCYDVAATHAKREHGMLFTATSVRRGVPTPYVLADLHRDNGWTMQAILEEFASKSHD